MFKKLFLILTASITLNANSTDTINSRLTFDLATNGMLNIKSNYLTYSLIRGVDSQTGEEGDQKLINPAKQSIDFDLTSVEWDGIFPKVEIKFPEKSFKTTKIDLSSYNFPNNGNYNNTDIIIRSAGLIGVWNKFLSDGSLTTNEKIDYTSLLLFNVLSLAETSMEVVGNGTKLNGFGGESYKKFNNTAKFIVKYKDNIQKAGVWLDLTHTMINQINLMIEASGIDRSGDSALADFYHKNYLFIETLDKLKSVAKVTGKISAGDEDKFKTTLAEQYKKLIEKGKLKGDKTIDNTLDSVAKEFGKEFKKTTDIDKQLILINNYVVQPLSDLLTIYRDKLLVDLKKLKKDNAPAIEIEKLEDKISWLRKGKLIFTLARLMFADDLTKMVKEEPQKAIPLLIDIVKGSAKEFLKSDSLETLAKNGYANYVVKNGGNYYKGIANIEKANAYMKAIALGNTIGNKLIPMIWDIFLTPTSLRTTIKDGKFSPYGVLNSKVQLYSKNGELLKSLNSSEARQEVTIGVEDGEELTLYVDMEQQKLFRTDTAPWIKSNVTPRTLYGINIHTPKYVREDFMCVRKLLGDNVDFTIHRKFSNKYNITANQCGSGTLLGNGWFNSTSSELYTSQYYSLTSILKKYKLETLSSDLANEHMSYATHTYNKNEDTTLEVYITDANGGLSIYKIHIVPKLKNLDFNIDTSSLTNSSLVIKFDNSNIQASLEDPIASYVWDWGDGTTSNGTTLSNINHTYTQQGTYGITLTITTQSGAVYAVTKDIFIATNINLNASRNGKNVTFSWGHVEGATKYELYIYNDKNGWESRNYDTYYELTETTKTLSLEANTTGLALISASNQNGTSSDLVKVDIPLYNPLVNQSPTAKAGADKTINFNQAVTLIGNESNDSDGNIVSYEWTENGSTLSNDVNFTKNDFSIGTHTITLIVTDNDGATGSDDIVITVLENNTTGTITHNGFTYNEVVSPHTGRVWLDRNLGANKVCTSLDDSECYGDYYQWGRNTDGHEKKDSETTTLQETSLTSTTNKYVVHPNYVLDGDWINNTDSNYSIRQNNWSKTDGSSVCPTNFRVPTIEELLAETNSANITNNTEAYNSFLRLSSSTWRDYTGGYTYDKEVALWSTSLRTNNDTDFKFLQISSSYSGENVIYSSSSAIHIRCIKNTSSSIITHNGFTYKEVISPNTGKIWLDRNLGANRVCTSFDDEECYGDYYQWGRGADGHEKKDSIRTEEQSDTLIPQHNNFITTSDWTSADIDGNLRSNYLSKIDGSSICPINFRVATKNEFELETNNSFLNIPDNGFRSGDNIMYSGQNQYKHYPYYWYSGLSQSGYHSYSNGLGIRCIKN